MLKAKPAKEILIQVYNDIKVLMHLTKLLSEKGINILAISDTSEGQEGHIRLVTDDNLRATDALRDKEYEFDEMDVVVTEAPHKPGMLKHITEKLNEEDIDIRHLFGSATGEEDICLIVFSSSDNARAIVLLNQ